MLLQFAVMMRVSAVGPPDPSFGFCREAPPFPSSYRFVLVLADAGTNALFSVDFQQ